MSMEAIMKLSTEEIHNRVDLLVQDLELCGLNSDLERKVIEAHVIKWHEDSVRMENSRFTAPYQSDDWHR